MMILFTMKTICAYWRFITHFLSFTTLLPELESSLNNLLLYIFSLKQSSHIQNFDCFSMPSFTIAILLAVLLHLLLSSREFSRES